eukprot:scpid92615/ scgid22935/ 
MEFLLARTMDLPADAYQPLEDAIRQLLIPALTSRNPPAASERVILALSCRLGGMGLIDPTLLCRQHAQSIKITECLVQRILAQDWSIDGVGEATRRAKAAARTETRQKLTPQQTSANILTQSQNESSTWPRREEPRVGSPAGL